MGSGDHIFCIFVFLPGPRLSKKEKYILFCFVASILLIGFELRLAIVKVFKSIFDHSQHKEPCNYF